MTFRRLYLVLAVFALAFSAGAQSPCGDSDAVAPVVDEKLQYLVTYKWGLIWAKAGEVTFTVSDTTFNGKPGYKFYGFGRSLKKWDWFFKVRSSYESVTDKQLKPVQFTRVGQEGDNNYFNEYIFHDSVTDFSRVDRNGDMEQKEIAINPCTFDVMSAIFYCRGLDFAHIPVDEKIALDLVMDGALHHSYVKFMGTVDLEHPVLKKTIKCYHFRPMLMSGTVFKPGENMDVYVTADERKIPIYVRTGLRVGHAKIWLTNTAILNLEGSGK